MRWELAAVLLEDRAAVDTVIFQRDGRWWMLTSWKTSKYGGQSDLHLYHAPAPIGPWTVVSEDPVVTDALTGRNGGFLSDGRSLYRVSQQADFGQYGNALTIHRIGRVDEHGYSEAIVQTVRAKYFPKLKGTHHMHNDGGLLVYDYWRNKRVR